MSETVFDKHIETAEIIHQINCDKCNKCISESEEYDDGYYYNPSEYMQKCSLTINGMNITPSYVRNVKESQPKKLLLC